MTILGAMFLGVVEGLTEFLPVSSTAHLLLGSHLLAIPESGFVSSFVIAIQLGAILAVVLMYWKTILWDFETMKRVVVAFIPTAIIGYLLYTLIKNVLFGNLLVIALALLLGGIVLVLFERLHKPAAVAAGPITYRNAFLIGIAQSLAIIPGVSRAGATILGGLALGVSREKIVEFSFLLAIPTMLAATGYDLLKNGFAFSANDWQLLAVGFVVSAAAAFVSVRFLIRFIQTHSFAPFGWYRVILGLGILALML